MMFMILHLSIPSAPQLLLLGIVIGILRVRSGSLWPCVLMHFTHNAMCIAFERWMM
jgi:membrane protease YdiL (CAAX protease family)